MLTLSYWHALITERADLDDIFLLTLVCHFVISCLLFRFMDSDHLFGIFELFLHIKHKDLPAQAYAILARFDYTDLT